MKETLEQIRREAVASMEAAGTAQALDELRVRYLGKKGELTAVLKQMGKLSPEERPVMGQLANEVRAALEEALAARGKELEAKALEDRLRAEALDITVPGKAVKAGLDYARGFSSEFLGQVKDISTPSVEAISANLDNGVEVSLGDSDDIAKKERIVTKLLSQVEGVTYINVRSPGNYTFRNAPTA